MKKIIYILLVCCSHSLSSQQCLEDRHTTNITDAWVSCQTSANPNNISGNSHWILYNFDAVKTLYGSTIWNINHPDYLNYGVKRIRIDHSLDKINWTFWGDVTLSQAPARSDYIGESGPDFDGLQTKHLLLTVIETHGDLICAGFSEIQISTEDTNCPDELVFDSNEDIYGVEIYQAAIQIEAQNTIHNTADVTLKAAECIQLTNDFELELGAKLHAYITDCSLEGDNMIINGDFETGNADPWEIELHQTASATLSIDNTNPYDGNACAKVEVTNTTDTGWHLQFEQFGMSVNAGQTYLLEFAARCNVSRTIQIGASRHNSPWNIYDSENITVIPAWQTFSMSFIPNETNIDFLRISAYLSNNDPATYWFDNFVLKAQ